MGRETPEGAASGGQRRTAVAGAGRRTSRPTQAVSGCAGHVTALGDQDTQEPPPDVRKSPLVRFVGPLHLMPLMVLHVQRALTPATVGVMRWMVPMVWLWRWP